VADLKLGPLPKQSTVKVTIELPELLKEELDAYAAEHGKLYEPVETKALIPHMLEAFLRADRAWCRRRKQRGRGKPVDVEPARPAPQMNDRTKQAS
jgi:hypothetical protein